MPTVDDRLEQLFTAAAIEPTSDADVFGAIARKRHQRRTRRVVRDVGALVAFVLVVVGSIVWLARDDATQPAIAPSTVREDAWLGAHLVAVDPDVGYVRGPLITAGEYVALAA